MGMGWPQQLDVRLDGRLLKHFTVGGSAARPPARPAMPATESRVLLVPQVGKVQPERAVAPVGCNTSQQLSDTSPTRLPLSFIPTIFR